MAREQKGELLAAAKDISEWMIDIRRQIHKFPELGFECCKTSKLVKEKLRELNVFYYEKPYGKTGVVGRIGSGNSPCVALRADMDAIPVQELHEWPYQSQVDGVMHACGHDAHVAMLLGAVKLLQERYERKEFEGTVLLIFQPAEEIGAGAKAMLEDGALKDAEAIFGLHVTDGAEAGWWASKPGTLMSGFASFSATINGRGGHGGLPHEAIDPIVASAFVITSLQPIISRETDPSESEVITVGSINGGEANNVIPNSVTMGGSLRHFRTDTTALEERKQRILEVIENQAKVHRCIANPCEWGEIEVFPVVNDEDAFEFAKGVVMEVLPDASKMLLLPAPVTASEDFSHFLHRVPGAFAFMGCAAPFPEDGKIYSVHSPKFVLDEACLAYGAAIHGAIAIEYIVNTPILKSPKDKGSIFHATKIGKYGT